MNAQDADGMERDCTCEVSIDKAMVDGFNMAQPMRVLKELREDGVFHVNQLGQDVSAALGRTGAFWPEPTPLVRGRKIASNRS